MQPVKKQITALGLLLLAALPLFLSVGLLIKQKMIREQRSQRFETELLQTITVSAGHLNWVNPGKEILIHGKLFDVKSFRTSGSNIILSGFYDHTEDKLVKQTEGLNQQKNNSNSPVNQLAFKFLFSPTYTCQSEITYEGCWKYISRQYYSFDEMIPASAGNALIHPPRL